MPRLIDGKSTAEVERYLQDLPFPALKHDVVHHARQKQAPSEIVSMLEQLPVTKFDSLQQVIATYGEVS